MRIFWGLLALGVLAAHDIITTKLTYTRDVSRIVARRCVECHSASASIPLTSYEEVRPWAVAIKQQVLSRQMPPWGAVKGFGHFAPDQGMSQEEMLIIAAWVVGGAPKGDSSLLPAIAEARPVQHLPYLWDAVVVKNHSKIEKPLRVAGIRPVAEGIVESARVVVRFPNGHVEPLLWLLHYDSEGRRTFRFREPLLLPAGSVVEGSGEVSYALEVGHDDQNKPRTAANH